MKIHKRIIKEESFTAKSKKSGKVVNFGSAETRDQAIKSGEYEEDKPGDGDSSAPQKPRVNIFDKPASKVPPAKNAGDKPALKTPPPTNAAPPIGTKVGGAKPPLKTPPPKVVGKPAAKVPPPPPPPPPIPASKVTSTLPKADSKTFNAPSDINKIPDAQKKEISMRIDKLAELTKQAKEKGEAAPNFNLCQVTVPGTNLYCSGNAGIPREEMPQFKGKPTPGSPASKMPVDASGEVDTEPMFKKMLADKGVKTVETEIPSDRLKATQSELVGSKVAGMAKALEKDPKHPGITAPIYVSRDGYVVDGHHRWAAVTSAAIAAGKPANMKVIVIDMDIKDIIPMSNKFAEDIGVAAKKADANQEGPNKSKESPKDDSTTQSGWDGYEEPEWLKGGDPTWGGMANQNSTWGDNPQEPDWAKGPAMWDKKVPPRVELPNMVKPKTSAPTNAAPPVGTKVSATTPPPPPPPPPPSTQKTKELPVKKHVEKIKKGFEKFSKEEKQYFGTLAKEPNQAKRGWLQALKDKAKGAGKAIKDGLKHEKHIFQTAGKGIGKLFSSPGGWNDLSPEEKKSIFSVGKKILMTGAVAGTAGVLGGGIGAAKLAGTTLAELAPHVIGETILKGLTRAAIFADENSEDEANLNIFAEQLIKALEELEITSEMLGNIAEKHTAQTESIVEGLATGMSVLDLAKKHNVSEKELSDELEKGIKVEMEHTSDKSVAEKIAMDHLYENPKYYTKLATIENVTEEISELTPEQNEMVSGIIEMLLQIKDIDNRMEVAKQQIQNFKDEGIEFNYAGFLSAAGLDNKDEPVRMDSTKIPQHIINKESMIKEEFKHLISVETPTQVVSKPVAAQILALAKAGVRSKDIGLKMGFVGNQKLATDAFQKVKNKIYFELGKKFEAVNVKVEPTEQESPEETLQSLNKMAMGDLERIEDYAEMIADRMKEGQELSAWMYSQITLAVDQLNAVHDTLDGKDGVKESVTEAMGNDKSMLALADVLSNSMEHYDESDFLQTVRGGQGWSGIPGFQNKALIPVFKSIYKKYWKVSPQNRTHWDLKDWINWLKPFGLEENWDSEMEPVEESTPGEQIQNLNNRLTKLRQDMAKAKSPEAKMVIQARMKNALQRLSNKKKELGIKKP